MTFYFEKYKKWENKLEVKLRKPLPYDFMIVFKLMVVIYFISTLFDLLFTYVTFHLTPEHFFKYEFSYIIKRTFAGDEIYYFISLLFFILPILFVYYFSIKQKKKYGFYICSSRYFLMYLFIGSWMHILGGLTNFIYLASLRVI